MERKWKNKSVLQFAGSENPVDAIRTRAQRLALDAMDRGWTGPPFDPVELARIHGIHVIATRDVRDARTIPSGRKATIEYNPGMSTSRIRYSIAHEIAHTMFPDWSAQTRYRSRHAGTDETDWELELLCNLAAAEFLMPMSLISDEVRDASIETVLALRKRYAVSTEAIAIRIIDIGRFPAASFSSSRREAGRYKDRYAIDYMVAAPGLRTPARGRALLAPETALRYCTAVGYTSVGEEEWPQVGRVRVEGVAVPPYPGQLYPRVVGLILPRSRKWQDRMAMSSVLGDAASPRGPGQKLIVHVVNDKTPNWGGQGFARALRKRWPGVQDEFRHYVRDYPDRLRLGSAHFSRASNDIWVGSLVAQKGYGEKGRLRVRYTALAECLSEVADFASRHGASVHMPRIGTGYGGGSWRVIEELIVSTVIRRRVPVTIYTLPGEENPPGPLRLEL